MPGWNRDSAHRYPARGDLVVLHGDLTLVQLFLTRKRQHCRCATPVLRRLAYCLQYLASAQTKVQPTAGAVGDVARRRPQTYLGAQLQIGIRGKPNRGFWNKLVDVVAGAPDYRFLVRPYSVTSDSHGRIIVTDPGRGGGAHFRFRAAKYKFIERREKSRDAMMTPQCVAVDAQDNIYVTDSDAGKIFVFEPSGKYVRAIGSLKGGEGYFKRPTGIAVDSTAAAHLRDGYTCVTRYSCSTCRATSCRRSAKSGNGEGEFNSH